MFLESKQKLGKSTRVSDQVLRLPDSGCFCFPALSPTRRVLPEFKTSLPLRKQRSGLLFTCATPVLCLPPIPRAPGPAKHKEVWICNTDGFVGQVCVLNLSPSPAVQPSKSILNARITCMETIPSYQDTLKPQPSSSDGGEPSEPSDNTNNDRINNISSGSDEDKEPKVYVDGLDHDGPTVWIGTEEGFIHIYRNYDSLYNCKILALISLSSAIQYIM